MMQQKVGCASYKLEQESEPLTRSFTTTIHTIEEFLNETDVIRKDVISSTKYTVQHRPPNYRTQLDSGLIRNAGAIPTFDGFDLFVSKQIGTDWPEESKTLEKDIPSDPETAKKMDDGETSEAGLNVVMGEDSKFKMGDRDCTTKHHQKVETTKLSTVEENGDITDTEGGLGENLSTTDIKMKNNSEFETGDTNCVEDKEVDIQAEDCTLKNNTGRGGTSAEGLEVDMDEESKFKMGNTDCTSKERHKIVTDKFVTEATNKVEPNKKKKIKMKKKSKFDIGDKKCVKEKEVDIQAKTCRFNGKEDGFGLPNTSDANININMGENATIKGSLLDQKAENGTNGIPVITEAQVTSMSEFEEIAMNHPSTIKRLSMNGDWIQDLDEFYLEDRFKKFQNLVDLDVKSDQLPEMPPVSCLERLRSLNLSGCCRIKPASVLRQLSCIKRPLKTLIMANCFEFRFKELLKVAQFVQNADLLDIRDCFRLCPIKMNVMLEETNIQKIMITKCIVCRDCEELKGEIGDHIKDMDRVEIY